MLGHLIAAVHSFLPQLHLQFTSSRIQVAAEHRGFQLLALLVQVISSHLQVPEEVSETFVRASTWKWEKNNAKEAPIAGYQQDEYMTGSSGCLITM